MARDVGLSVRRPNEIFQADDSSISRDISRARIAADLANPQFARRSVSDITFANGVTNFQSFTRLFRKRFDKTPQEFRADAAL